MQYIETSVQHTNFIIDNHGCYDEQLNVVVNLSYTC